VGSKKTNAIENVIENFRLHFIKNAKIQLLKGHLRDKARTSKGHKTDISSITTLSNQNRGKQPQSQIPSQSHFKISITYFSKMSVYLYRKRHLVFSLFFLNYKKIIKKFPKIKF